MKKIEIGDLPPPPPGKTGWPWTGLSEGPSDAKFSGHRDAGEKDGWPRITIVTPSYNQGEFIEETIRSVLLQGYPELEYFIFDGGSSDDTVEIINKYEQWITAWVSAPDGGQADAIAKGFDKAGGVRLGWINSDDVLMPGAMFSVGAFHKASPESLIAGGVLNFDPASGKSEVIRPRNITLRAALRLWERSMIWHQPGLFFPRAAYRLAGGLDRSLTYTMDHDLLCRLLRIGTPVAYMEDVLASFRLHAGSKTMAANTRMALEAYRTVSRYWPLLGDSYLYYAFRMLIHFILRSGKAMVCGDVRVALQSIKGGTGLFFQYIKNPGKVL